MRLAQNVAGKPLNIFPQKKYHFYKKPDPRLYKKNKSSLNISRPCYPEGGKERNSVTTQSQHDKADYDFNEITDIRQLLPIFSPARYYKEVNTLKQREEKQQARKIKEDKDKQIAEEIEVDKTRVWKFDGSRSIDLEDFQRRYEAQVNGWKEKKNASASLE